MISFDNKGAIVAKLLRIAYPGAFYHITLRENERKDIFKSQRDRKKFISYLESATERNIQQIIN